MCLEKSWKYDIVQHTSFVDLEKAFDKVHMDIFGNVSENENVPLKTLQAKENTYVSPQGCEAGGREGFKINAGVRQGGVLPPALLIIYMERLTLETRQLRNGETKCFSCADNVALVAISRKLHKGTIKEWNNKL